MSRALHPPSFAEAFSNLKRRVTALERVLGDARQLYRPDTTFSHPADVAATESPPYTPPVKRRYRGALLQLGEAGTTDTDVEVRLNGAVVASYTIAADITRVEGRLSVEVGPADRLTVAVVDAGTGAARLSVILRS